MAALALCWVEGCLAAAQESIVLPTFTWGLTASSCALIQEGEQFLPIGAAHWHTPLIPALRQEDLCESEVSKDFIDPISQE